MALFKTAPEPLCSLNSTKLLALKESEVTGLSDIQKAEIDVKVLLRPLGLALLRLLSLLVFVLRLEMPHTLLAPAHSAFWMNPSAVCPDERRALYHAGQTTCRLCVVQLIRIACFSALELPFPYSCLKDKWPLLGAVLPSFRPISRNSGKSNWRPRIEILETFAPCQSSKNKSKRWH